MSRYVEIILKKPCRFGGREILLLITQIGVIETKVFLYSKISNSSSCFFQIFQLHVLKKVSYDKFISSSSRSPILKVE